MSRKSLWSIVSWLLIGIFAFSSVQPAVLAAEDEVVAEETAPAEAPAETTDEETPAEPETPAEGEQPSETTEPEEPAEPTEPQQPEEPSEPAEPEEPEEPYTGWKETEGGTQYWDNGTPVTGLKEIEYHLYYFNAAGFQQTGWQTIDGNRYYFDELTATAATGIVQVGEEKYAFDEQTSIQKTGWQTIESNVYYFDPSTGVLATGITTISGKKYLLSDEGVRLTGWHTISGKKYYASAKGVLYSGQHKIGKYYYYFDKKTNVMAVKKFVELTNSKGKKYTVYYNKYGRKLFGDQTIGKYKYHFSSKAGSMYKSKFVKKTDKKGKTYKIYYDSKGRQAFGKKTIKGHIYYFNKKTGKLEWKDRKYQNPKGYYQIQSTDIKLKGAGYSLDIGSEGLKVRAVLQKLGISNGVGMYGSLYTSYVKERVKDFQRSHGLKVDGIVGLYTWKAMGFTKKQWLSLGGYASPNQGTIYNTKAELIEIMIDRAYDYLGDDYVIGASGAPGKGIDCSGLVMQALFAVGIDMTPINPVRHAHVDYEYESANIWKSPYLKHVPYSDRKRGDIVIYQNSYGTVIHSAIYLGNNMVIESWPNKVMVSNITASFHSNVKGILRVFN